MTRFHLQRKVDSTGVSGTGRVAEGVVFVNGKVALSWLTPHTSVAVYDDLAVVHAIHGHDGNTQIVFDEPVCSACGHRWSQHWADNCGGCMACLLNPGTARCMCTTMGNPSAHEVEGPPEVYDPILPSERERQVSR